MVNFFIGEPLSAYLNFMALSFVSLLCYVFMNACRFLIMLGRLVLEGGLNCYFVLEPCYVLNYRCY